MAWFLFNALQWLMLWNWILETSDFIAKGRTWFNRHHKVSRHIDWKWHPWRAKGILYMWLLENVKNTAFHVCKYTRTYYPLAVLNWVILMCLAYRISLIDLNRFSIRYEVKCFTWPQWNETITWPRDTIRCPR